MLLMGDEMGRTKHGNNNTYCHDNELNWLDWSLLKKNKHLFEVAQGMIRVRRAHTVPRSSRHFTHSDYVGSGYPDISFHGTKAWNMDGSEYSRSFAFMLDGDHAKQGVIKDSMIYVAMNMFWESLSFELPVLSRDRKWHVF